MEYRLVGELALSDGGRLERVTALGDVAGIDRADDIAGDWERDGTCWIG